MKCPDCDGDVTLIPAAETLLRVLVVERRPTSYPAAVAACSSCEWAASIVETQERGVVVKEMR